MTPLRLPFYWEIKTLFLLFLSLPQFEARAYRKILISPMSYSSVIFFFPLCATGLDLSLQILYRTVPRSKRVRH